MVPERFLILYGLNIYDFFWQQNRWTTSIYKTFDFWVAFAVLLLLSEADFIMAIVHSRILVLKLSQAFE
jgi:hypothetical protein